MQTVQPLSVAKRGMPPVSTPTTLRQAVVEQLRERIVSGVLPPGSLLREIALAESLGVSPTPVREAFGELASEGLVQIEAHRLKRVSPIDAKAMLDLFRVQAELWRLGYVWGMPRIGVPELEALDNAVGEYRAGIQQEDPLRSIRASHTFSTVFIVASANSELLRSTLDRRSVVARFILLHGRATLSVKGLRHHEAMLRALRERDAAGVLAGLDQLSQRLFRLAEDVAARGSSFNIER